ncbi:hypothetical protein GLOIN_2v1841574 [Rhizophagus irregularis DAOM 181602=DAOM 197198]|uniref:DUF8211 domain-containing protein n=1 Tax=Rhizophagus irregularis (strain DAOM 181602 / DAOM 197198 / MUCL 43194) TaxID=747089 RepID=A0A2P4PZ10_RHIID|nr:hypothetical protein GLOIN_2v1841574 [Rhizophagus irregularis DAOM 181602=DAOM 197198]POG70616.1 hypothetical protein GLOIN_2v1841574 [Rhizophagus irregularis DAOM 181602=DAOM 197198]|eukprot:XP_025177482.1 hypothetical protein GLOIN_2v1841574 [Rhizophagus irregularis DAOM 181602=DAOM 197198]
MDVEYKLHAAKQHRFLFLKSQGFNKPITHLKYKKKKDFAYTDDYKYKIPITSFLRTNPVSDAICETPSTSSTIKTQTNDQSTPTDTPLVFTGKATDYYTSDGEYAQRNLDNVLIDDKGLKNHASFYLIKILRLLRITSIIIPPKITTDTYELLYLLMVRFTLLIVTTTGLF